MLVGEAALLFYLRYHVYKEISSIIPCSVTEKWSNQDRVVQHFFLTPAFFEAWYIFLLLLQFLQK